MHLEADGAWMALLEPNDFVRSLLPPELEVPGLGADGSTTYPVVLAVQEIELAKFGPVSTGIFPPRWHESIVLVPGVRFRGASTCATQPDERFSYVVTSYIDNRIVLEGTKRTLQGNRSFGDVRVASSGTTFTGSVRVDGSEVLQLAAGHPGQASTREAPPPAIAAAWDDPALASGTSGSFVRYQPKIRRDEVFVMNGTLGVSERHGGLPTQRVQFGEDGAVAVRLKGSLTLGGSTTCN